MKKSRELINLAAVEVYATCIHHQGGLNRAEHWLELERVTDSFCVLNSVDRITLKIIPTLG